MARGYTRVAPPWLLGTALLLLLLGAGIGVAGLQHARTQVEDRALGIVTAAAQPLAVLLQQDAGALATVGQTLLQVGPRSTLAPPLLRALLRSSPRADGISVLDRRGRVLLSTVTRLTHAQELRGLPPIHHFSVGPVRRDHLLHTWVIPVYQPVWAHGKLQFFVVLLSTLVHAEQFWSHMPIPAGSISGVMRTDEGLVELLWPPRSVAHYRTPPGGALARALTRNPSQSSGHFSGLTGPHHIYRLGAFARIGTFPLVAFLSVPRATVWALWARSIAIPEGLLLLLFASLIATYWQARKRAAAWTLERAEAARRLQASERRARAAGDAVGDGIITTDTSGIIQSINAAAERLTGCPAAQALGAPLETVYQPRDLESHAALPNPVTACLGQSGNVRARVAIGTSAGTWVPVEQSVSAYVDDQGQAAGVVLAFADLTEKAALISRLQFEARHDPLTGLPNRSSFYDAVQRQASTGGSFAVLLIDLQGLGRVNDAHGQQTGDQALSAAAQRLRAHTNAPEVVARYGGDDFAALLHCASLEVARERAERLVEAFHTPLLSVPQEVFLGLTIGLAWAPEHGQDADSLCQAADAALFSAKRSSSSHGVSVFRPSAATEPLRTLSLDAALHHALERAQLEVLYQPQVEVRSGRLLAAEALLRWHHPELGLIPPTQFIPLAEQGGLILPIGRWVLETACAQAKRWRDEIGPVVVGVNLSARQCLGRDLARDIADILQRTGLPAKALQLELTESLLIRAEDEIVRNLEGCRELGVSLAIDDFGTGYSSLSYLKHLPVDTLKIDHSFMAGVPQRTRDNTVVQAVVTIGHSLGLRIVAEGIETAAQMEFIRRAQCDVAQGFAIGRPMTPNEFAPMLNQSQQRRRSTPSK